MTYAIFVPTTGMVIGGVIGFFVPILEVGLMLGAAIGSEIGGGGVGIVGGAGGYFRLRILDGLRKMQIEQ